jgi:hypothetical protein
MRSFREQALDRFAAADAAANLHVERPLSEDVTNEIRIGATSGRGVEIHEVEASKSMRREIPRNRRGIVELHTLLVLGFATGLCACSAAKVDGRDGDHGRA